MTDLKNKALQGFKWSAIERLLTQGIQFILMIVIARMLSPADFGLVGMLAIFLAIAQTFIDSGFSSALIRKGEPSEKDCSTAFYFNIVVGVVCYGVLFFSAPYIAVFYQEPTLEILTQVISLNVLLSSFSVVQRAKITIAMDFKTQTKVSLISVIISGAIGVTMAWNGYGVWSLVAQTVLMNGLQTLLLGLSIRWYPKAGFCMTAFRDLFGFGSRLLASALIDTVYRNIYLLVIGKQFSTAQLGYFTQAKKLTELPAINITAVIQRVNYPLMSQIKENDVELEQAYGRALKYSAMFVFPLMAALAVLAEPLIKLLLGDQWLPTVPLLSILCLPYMLYPIHAINLNLLQVKGRSDLFLRLEIIKKVINTIILLVTMQYGVKAMCMGIALSSCIGLWVNTYYTGQLLGLGIKKQFQLLSPVSLCTAIAALAGATSIKFVQGSAIQLMLGAMAGLMTYLLLLRLFCSDEYAEMTSTLRLRYGFL